MNPNDDNTVTHPSEGGTYQRNAAGVLKRIEEPTAAPIGKTEAARIESEKADAKAKREARAAAAAS